MAETTPRRGIMKVNGVEYLSPEVVAYRLAQQAETLEGKPIGPISIRLFCRQYVESGGKFGIKGEKFQSSERAPWWIKWPEVERWLKHRRRGPGNPTFGRQSKSTRKPTTRKRQHSEPALAS